MFLGEVLRGAAGDAPATPPFADSLRHSLRKWQADGRRVCAAVPQPLTLTLNPNLSR